MKKTVHFKALITYFTTEKGGLVSPISDGYRSDIRFPFESQTYIAIHNFSDAELIFPGDSAAIDVTLVGAEKFLDHLYTGMDFELFNNSGIIGTGVITEMNKF